MATPRYRCSKCSLGVIVLSKDGETHVIRGCKCEAGVIADMSATVVARGGMRQTGPRPKLSLTIDSVKE